jgi:hypothetical protein
MKSTIHKLPQRCGYQAIDYWWWLVSIFYWKRQAYEQKIKFPRIAGIDIEFSLVGMYGVDPIGKGAGSR